MHSYVLIIVGLQRKKIGAFPNFNKLTVPEAKQNKMFQFDKH